MTKFLVLVYGVICLVALNGLSTMMPANALIAVVAMMVFSLFVGFMLISPRLREQLDSICHINAERLQAKMEASHLERMLNQSELDNASLHRQLEAKDAQLRHANMRCRLLARKAATRNRKSKRDIRFRRRLTF